MTDQPKGSRPDPIGEFQRWLFRSGARGMTRELGGQIRTAMGRSRGTGDVWESATADPPDEAPECAWCPVCRAARMLREPGPGLTAPVTAAGDLLATVVQDAMSAVESALASVGRPAQPGARDADQAPSRDKAAREGAQPPSSEASSGDPDPAGPPEGLPHGPDDRG